MLEKTLGKGQTGQLTYCAVLKHRSSFMLVKLCLFGTRGRFDHNIQVLKLLKFT